MISPIKNRAEEKHDDKENVPKPNKKASKANESFSKKNVTKCINSIKEAMNSLSDKVRGLKEKSHGLVLQFNPLFNYVAESNAPIARYHITYLAKLVISEINSKAFNV